MEAVASIIWFIWILFIKWFFCSFLLLCFLWWYLWTYYYLDSDLLVYILLYIHFMPIIKNLFLFISFCLLYILVRGWNGVGGWDQYDFWPPQKMNTEPIIGWAGLSFHCLLLLQIEFKMHNIIGCVWMWEKGTK